jgi:hypothetical protein
MRFRSDCCPQAAGVAGFLLALESVHLWARYGPTEIPVPNSAYDVTLPQVHVGAGEILFTLVVSLATGSSGYDRATMACYIPGRHVGRINPLKALHSE